MISKTALRIWGSVVVGLVGISLVGAYVLSLTRSHQPTESPPYHPTASQVSSVPRPSNNTHVPAHVLATLRKIDAGTWPDDSGAHGGQVWHNREHLLPAKTANNTVIHYREWDVNSKKPRRNRDAQRIITGSDGSAYYTLDHYRSFHQIR